MMIPFAYGVRQQRIGAVAADFWLPLFTDEGHLYEMGNPASC
jgi:hypothetical protein